MSDYYQFKFDFGLDPYLPEGAASVFQALAGAKKPTKSSLAALPEAVREYLSTPSLLIGGDERMNGGVPPHPVCLTHQPTADETAYHARTPEWHVSFGLSVHDDWYGNGAFTLPLAMMEIVGDNGLFGVEFEQSGRDRVTHYYREHEDLLVVRMGAPFSCSRVPPLSGKSVTEHYPDFRQATEADFRVESLVRFTPADRARMYAEAKKMLDDLMDE